MVVFLDKSKLSFISRYSWVGIASLFVFTHPGYAAIVDPIIEQRIAQGKETDVLVLMNDNLSQSKLSYDEKSLPPLSEQKGKQYKYSIQTRNMKLRNFKEEFKNEVRDQGIEHVEDFDSLPILHIKLKSIKALERLKNNPKVKSIDLNSENHLLGTNNLDLIGQPRATARGYNGAGTSVCVLDTGVAYTLPEFGCSSGLGAPSCKVAAYVDISGANAGSLDPNGHGSNVSSIVLQVAPSSKILGLNVFTGKIAYTSDTIQGINWCINNKATYNIVALNMSFGAGSYANPVPLNIDSYGAAIASAINSGIAVIAAAGNDANKANLTLPAAYSGVVSVGAVFDSPNYTTFSSCTGTSGIDKVACFSNSAYFLTLLAPGVNIYGGGGNYTGTSQASPHVAGAVAVVKSAYPDDTEAQVLSLLESGPYITDSNGIKTARLALTKLIKYVRNDLNGDGISDLIWRQASTGALGISFTGSTGNTTGWAGLGAAPDWTVTAIGDFNGDGIPDMLWHQTSTGSQGEAFMNFDGTINNWNTISTGADWSVVNTLDLNGDGISDLIWRQASTGALGISFTGSTGNSTGWAGLGAAPDWTVTAIGDFNGDGIPDMLWRQTSTGSQGEVFMNSNGTVKGWNTISTGTDWSVVNTLDLNGDGITDLIWRQASTGALGISFTGSAGNSTGWAGLGAAPDWTVTAIGDFNGDGIPDMLWRQTSTGSQGEVFMNSNGTVKGWNTISTGADWSVVGE